MKEFYLSALQTIGLFSIRSETWQWESLAEAVNAVRNGLALDCHLPETHGHTSSDLTEHGEDG